MPCDQRQLMSIDWANADETILKSAMESLGLHCYPDGLYGGYVAGLPVSVYRQAGKLTIQASNPQGIERAIRCAYGEQTVRAAARRFGWNVHQDASATQQQQFTVRRRA